MNATLRINRIDRMFLFSSAPLVVVVVALLLLMANSAVLPITAFSTTPMIVPRHRGESLTTFLTVNRKVRRHFGGGRRITALSPLWVQSGQQQQEQQQSDIDNTTTSADGSVPASTATASNVTSSSSSSSSSSQSSRPALLAEAEDLYIECQFEDFFDGTKPDSSWNLAYQNFVRQGSSILKQVGEKIGLVEYDGCRPPDCLGLKLSNEAVKQAEERRIKDGGKVDAHPVSQALYDLGCFFLDELFDERPIPRFWFLEVIARIPYFSYVSMLHLYESFGWFRAVELRKVHAAEDWNELHHLLIMESLGGNTQWSDRFLGYHVALAYYWFLIIVYLFSPRIAYEFMELLEAHAVDTYTTFLNENRKRLSQLPPPAVARSYYKTGDLYLFDDFQVSRPPGSRRPPCENLLDVFANIAVDEGEHVKTMQACQDYASFGIQVVSPHLRYTESGCRPKEEEDNYLPGDNSMVPQSNTDKVTAAARDIELELSKREQWKKWSEAVNSDNQDN